MQRALLIAAALVPLLACAPRAVIPDAERARVSSELDGKQRYLRVAAYADPLWGDQTKLLLTDQPGDELDLVESAGGTPVPPPAPQRIVPPGTPARIREVEFPTGWQIARRVVMSPRYHPWAILEVSGDPRPHVVVLSQTAVSFEEIRGELDRMLTTDDPTSFLGGLPGEHRDAILKKQLVEGMSARAVEMAWGLPERKKIDKPAATEAWTWPGAKRKAFFQEERLVRWEK